MGSYLHPDHAYVSGSRRGSSQSEQLEVETYQLSEDFSRSLPGSRRSSFQKEGEKQGTVLPLWYYSHTWRLSETITLLRTRYICHPIPRISAETKPLFLIFYPHLYFYYLFSVLYIYLLILNTILHVYAYNIISYQSWVDELVFNYM